MDKVDELAKILWDYHFLGQKPEKSDCILVLGSHDLRVAEYAVELFKEGYAPFIIFSGGVAHKNDLLATGWDKSEAEVMSELAIKKGISKDKILVENKSTNTSDNFRFVQNLLDKKDLKFNSFIIVQKPYMQRRVRATADIVWPDKKLTIVSPPLGFDEYVSGDIPKEKVINIIVGDVQRIKLYPEVGWQSYQEIPDEVWQAYEELIKLGYDKHLLKDHFFERLK